MSTANPAARSLAPTQPAPSFCLYRAGEIVWFRNNNTWRIGLVKLSGVINQPTPNGQTRNEPNYIIVPIAHGATALPETSKCEMDTRPFLTFSVPEVQYPALRDKLFSQVDWPSFVAQEAGGDMQLQQLIVLEASKMAAVRIDHSFSLFNRLGNQPVDPNSGNNAGNQKVFYGGIFLGPERIEIGIDAVRVRLKSPAGIWNDSTQVIVLVTKYLFTTIMSSTFIIVGDLYHLKPSEMPPTQEQMTAANLPQTVRNDLVFRNRVAQKVAAQQQQFGTVIPGPKYWTYKLIKAGWPAPEENIMGRFYESHRILRIVDPVSFQRAMANINNGVLASGEQPMSQVETQRFLNGRGDTNGPEGPGVNVNIGKVSGRFAAIGGAIPRGVEFSLGDEVIEDST